MLSDWLVQLVQRRSHTRVGWLLDHEDNDLSRLMAHLVASLNTIGFEIDPAVLELLDDAATFVVLTAHRLSRRRGALEAASDPGYVNSLLAAATGRGTVTADIGLMQTAFALSGFTYLVGGLVFGIALFRTRVLARWGAVLLALASVFTASLAVLPDAFYRFLAFPNGIAMIGLGCSLWLSIRTATAMSPKPVESSLGIAAGAR